MTSRATLAPRHRSFPGLCFVLLLGLALLGSIGCKKKGAPSSYAGDGGGDYAEAEQSFGGGYDYSDDMADAEMDAAADYGPGGGNMAARSRAKHRSVVTTRDSFREEAPPAPPAEPKPAPEAEPVSEVEGQAGEPVDEEPKTEPAPAGQKRQIIYTATMQVSVYDVEYAASELEALPDHFGGWLQQRRDTQFVLRVPAEQLEAAMEFVAELGVVDYRALQALDVTAEYTDLASRIRVLEQMQAQLQALLDQSKSVEQALEIRKALDEVTMELELARGRMRELAKAIAFSTLVVGLTERGPAQAVPSSNDPFTWVDDLGVEATEYR